MDTRRLILVLIFTFSSFMLWGSWQKFNQPKPPSSVSAGEPAGNAVPQPSSALQAVAAAPVTGQQPAAIAAGDTFMIQTDLVKATISMVGGDIVELDLLKYKTQDGKDMTLAPVSYTHLDVYKRQPLTPPANAKSSSFPLRWSINRIRTPLFRNDNSRRRLARIS